MSEIYEATTDADGEQHVTVRQRREAVTFPGEPRQTTDYMEDREREGARGFLRRMRSFGGE
jgi:hypothetical protein